MSVGNQSNAKFYSIFDGKICRSFKTPQEGTTARTNKQGNIVHELFYDFIDGVVIAVRLREHAQYGKSWIIVLKDENELQALQFPYSSQYSQAFLKMLPNIDLKQTVKIIPSKKQVDGKDKLTLFVTQGGTPVKHFWAKERKGDLPDLVKVRYKGQDTWDDTDQMEFLERFVVEKILPQLGQKTLKEQPPAASATSGGAGNSSAGVAAAGNNGAASDIVDDLPF